MQEPPSEELVRRVAEALNTPLPSLPGASPIQSRGTVSPSALHSCSTILYSNITYKAFV